MVPMAGVKGVWAGDLIAYGPPFCQNRDPLFRTCQFWQGTKGSLSGTTSAIVALIHLTHLPLHAKAVVSCSTCQFWYGPKR